MGKPGGPGGGNFNAAKTEKTNLNTTFHLEFLERLYEGSPRWWAKEYAKFTEKVPGDTYETLEREPGVKQLIYLAHDRKQFYVKNPFFETCVNPVCPLRAWVSMNFIGTGHLAFVRNETPEGMHAGELTKEARNQFQETVMRNLRYLVEGNWGQLEESCPQCGKKMPVFGVSRVSDKWIYVLKESGQALTPELAIYAQSADTGFVYTQYKNGAFTSEGHAFNGRLIIDKIETQTWHFFLSPVKLGPQALKLLTSVPSQDGTYASKRSAASPDKWKVAAFGDLQPWSATVKRKFTTRQLKTQLEYIPLVDPFAWAAEIADFDYLPILAAQQKLIQDPDEQSKAFVASTLAQVVGTKKVSDDPPKWEVDDDKFDVKDESVPVPPSFSSSSNIAQAWVNRYQSTLDYLTQETNFACSRLWFPVRFSMAHRIVELACQENKDDPEFLTFGLIHWAHILREMLACQAGEAFIGWLGLNDDAKDRIPQKNVLGGDSLDPKSKLGAAIGISLPVHILMYVSPVIAASSDKPGQVMQLHLEQIGVHATTYGLKDALAIRDLALSISQPAVDNYLAKMPASLDASKLRKAAIAETMKSRIEMFTSLKAVEEGMTLLIEISEYGKTEERTDSEWERNAFKDKAGVAQKVKEKIDTPAKVARFLGEQAHKLMKATWLSGEAETELVEKLEKEGLRKGFASLTKEQAEIYAASRSLATFRWVGMGLKVLAGPVGIAIGLCELAAQGKEIAKAMRAGDPAAVVGHGLEAAAAALIIVVAGAECAALFITGAAAAAWAGPVGWIAAALMLIGGIIIAFWSKNDLQLYTSHCFLGTRYGDGEYDKTEKAWMGNWGWAQLRYDTGMSESKQRWQRQRLALLRLLCGFRTFISSFNYAGGTIFTGYLPVGSFIEIEIDVTPTGKETPKETFSLAVWAVGQPEWKPPAPMLGSVQIEAKDANVSAVTFSAPPNKFSNRDVSADFRVRLLFDASAKHGLPVTTKWVKNGRSLLSGWSNYKDVPSTSADTDTKEKDEKEEGEGKETGSGE